MTDVADAASTPDADPAVKLGPRLRSAAREFGYTGLSLGLVGALWYLVIVIAGIKPYVLPYPHTIVSTIFDKRDLLFHQSVVTTREIVVGFAIEAVLGVAIGLMMAFSRAAHRVIYPALVVAQSVPKVALAPLFLAWFGFGMTMNLTVTVLIAIFPVIVNTMVGMDAIDPDMVRLGRALGASRIRLFWKIRLPVALPAIFAGLKLAMTFSAVGAVIGEFIGGSSGLGYLIEAASGRLDTATAIAGIVVISAITVVLFKLVELSEAICLKHREGGATW